MIQGEVSVLVRWQYHKIVDEYLLTCYTKVLYAVCVLEPVKTLLYQHKYYTLYLGWDKVSLRSFTM